MNRDGLPPRRAALELVNGVLADGRLLSELSPALSKLDPGDRARAQRLATGTLRWLERCKKRIEKRRKDAADAREVRRRSENFNEKLNREKEKEANRGRSPL